MVYNKKAHDKYGFSLMVICWEYIGERVFIELKKHQKMVGWQTNGAMVWIESNKICWNFGKYIEYLFSSNDT